MARCKFFPVTYCDDPAVFLDQTQHDSLNSTQSWLHLLKLYPCPLHPYYWSHPTLTSSLFVRRVSSKWQDVLISLGWLDAINLCTVLFCFLFFSLVYSGLVSSRTLCLPPDLAPRLWIGLFVCPRRSKSSRPALCPCAPSPWERGGFGCQQVGCLPWPRIKARVEVGMHGVEWEVMRLDVGRSRWYSVSRYTAALSPPKQEATVHWSSLREGIMLSWPPPPCHQPNVLLLMLTRCASVTTYDVTPPPAKPSRIPPPSLGLFALARAAKLVKQIRRLVLKCDNISRLPKRKKSIKTQFTAQQSVFLTVARFGCEWQTRFC